MKKEYVKLHCAGVHTAVLNWREAGITGGQLALVLFQFFFDFAEEVYCFYWG